jgi:hypothetical protein
MKDIITSSNIKNSLGSFWHEFFDDSDSFLEAWSQSLAVESRQIEQNTQELRDLTGVQTTPVYHTENWRALTLWQDADTKSLHPIRYSNAAAKYGEPGQPPLYNRIFSYGDLTDGAELSIDNDDEIPKEVVYLVDSTTNPSFILVNGVDFSIIGSHIVLTFDPDKKPELDSIKSIDIETNQLRYRFLAYGCKYDMHYAARQWGYLLGFERESGKEYNQALWALWRARRFGMTPLLLKEIISIYTGCPVCTEEGETVERVFGEDNSGYTIITSSGAYALRPDDTPAVKEGQILEVGQFLGKRIEVIETSPAGFIRNEVCPLNPYHDIKLLGDDNYIETNYIMFTADSVPATIYNVDSNPVPTRATIHTGGGSFDVTVERLSRFGASKFALSIATNMIYGKQTQPVSIQVYTSEGVPFFVEPYTGSTDPVKGLANFITDRDDLLKLHRDALTDKVKKVRRVALVAMFSDTESYSIKSMLESYYFPGDQSCLGVTVIKTANLYDDLGESGLWLTMSVEQLLNFDMLLVNTSSGVRSDLDEAGQPKLGEELNNSPVLRAVLDNIESSLESVRNSILEIDHDFVWLLNYINRGDSAEEVGWLHSMCGILNTPYIDSTEGSVFYKYGLFSNLDPDEVRQSESNNNKSSNAFRIPTNLWESSTGSGVNRERGSIPVFSRRITVSSTSPQSVAELSHGVPYTYRVAKVEEN